MIEIDFPFDGDHVRLGDALETVPMLIATRIADESGIPRGVVVIGVQRIENGREIVKGPDDPEFQELLNSPEWERLEMDCEKEYQMFRNETAHECRMKFESAIKNGTLKVVNGFTDALIPIQSLKDWLASMGVDAKENRQPNDSNKADITKSTPIETDDWRNNPSLTKGDKQRRAILEAIATKGYEPFAIPDGGKVTLEALCRDLYPDIFDGETSFGNAWKAGNGTHWRMANYASFSKRWER